MSTEPSDGGCTVLHSFATTSTTAGYVNDSPSGGTTNMTYASQVASTDAGVASELWLEVWWNNPSFKVPVTGVFDDSFRYQTCSLCVGMGVDCVAGQGCQTSYFAVRGSLSVTQADEAPSGRISANGSSLHLVEWNFAPNVDRPVAGGKCLELTAYAVDVTWDGGS